MMSQTNERCLGRDGVRRLYCPGDEECCRAMSVVDDAERHMNMPAFTLSFPKARTLAVIDTEGLKGVACKGVYCR